MCMSPHEMTSSRLEELVERNRRYADEEREAGNVKNAKYYQDLADRFAEILKERAEDGSYHDNVDPATGDKRY